MWTPYGGACERPRDDGVRDERRTELRVKNSGIRVPLMGPVRDYACSWVIYTVQEGRITVSRFNNCDSSGITFVNGSRDPAVAT